MRAEKRKTGKERKKKNNTRYIVKICRRSDPEREHLLTSSHPPLVRNCPWVFTFSSRSVHA